MEVKVNPINIQKGKTVILRQDLPNDKKFGNRYIIKEGSRGEVISVGFEFVRLKVKFYSHYLGNQIVKFNEFSASNLLTTDIF